MASQHLPLNASVIVAFMIDGRPMAVHCTVDSEAPTLLYTRDARVTDIPMPQAVVLVWHHEDGVSKGEGDVIAIRPYKTGYLIEVEHTVVQEQDRRTYTRYPIETHISLRSVSDISGATVIALSQGITKDISIGGLWVEVQPPVPMGSVVECKFTVGEEVVSALALVAQASATRGGNGLEFLDFYGDSRERMSRGLRRAA